MAGELRVVWVGKNKAQGLKEERKAIKKYGDALMSSGPIILRGKETFGYAINVRQSDFNRVKENGFSKDFKGFLNPASFIGAKVSKSSFGSNGKGLL